MADVLDIKELQRRKQIEDRYQEAIKTWNSQLDFTIRLLKTEHEIKCRVAESIRDQELRNDTPQWPLLLESS